MAPDRGQLLGGALCLHDDRIADAHGVEVPRGVIRAEIDAAVTDIRVAL
jgi:hypothetical protein